MITCSPCVDISFPFIATSHLKTFNLWFFNSLLFALSFSIFFFLLLQNIDFWKCINFSRSFVLRSHRWLVLHTIEIEVSSIWLVVHYYDRFLKLFCVYMLNKFLTQVTCKRNTFLYIFRNIIMKPHHQLNSFFSSREKHRSLTFMYKIL